MSSTAETSSSVSEHDLTLAQSHAGARASSANRPPVFPGLIPRARRTRGAGRLGWCDDVGRGCRVHIRPVAVVGKPREADAGLSGIFLRGSQRYDAGGGPTPGREAAHGGGVHSGHQRLLQARERLRGSHQPGRRHLQLAAQLRARRHRGRGLVPRRLRRPRRRRRPHLRLRRRQRRSQRRR